MARVVTIHQPNYLPWIGLFSKIKLADIFIIYDTAQYTNNSVINRNKIRTSSGWCYLTIPINKHFSYARIQEVTLPADTRWQEDHWKSMAQSYSRTGYFKEHQDFFEKLYHEKFQYLWQVNEKILLYVLKCFNINIEVIRASDLGVDPNLHKTDAIIAYLKRVGADAYISGPSGKCYLDLEKFQQNNIELKFFKFQHPIYQQLYPGFEPNMAAIDLLFNVGPQASEIIRTSAAIGDFGLSSTLQTTTS